MEGIYLDNNATTKLDDRVFAAMRPYLTNYFGHPSSPHILGTKVRQKMEEARDVVAVLLGTTHPDEIALIYLQEEYTRVRKLRDQLETGLFIQIPQLRVNGKRETWIPNTTNITFNGLDGRKLLKPMEGNDIYASSGAACTEGKTPSYVLLAMGLPHQDAFSSIRFGPSRYNTEVEIEYVTDVIALIVSHIRAGMTVTLRSSPAKLGYRGYG